MCKYSTIHRTIFRPVTGGLAGSANANADPHVADLLNQAKSTATSAMNTASGLASQAANTASDLATQAVSSQTGANMTEQAKALGGQAQTMAGQAQSVAGNLAGQAHVQAHAMAPGIVPAPADAGTGTGATGEVDRSDDVEPDNKAEMAKFQKLFDSRSTPQELKDKGILKGGLSPPKADRESTS